MPVTDPTPKLPKLPFLLGDALLLGTAWLIADRSAQPLSGDAVLGITACVAIGACLAAAPFIADYARRRDEALDDRQRELEALARTVSTSADQTSITVKGLEELIELAKKTVRDAEEMPAKVQETFAKFQEANRAKTQERVAELRTQSEAKAAEARAQAIASQEKFKADLVAEITKTRADDAEKFEAAAAKIGALIADLALAQARAAKDFDARVEKAKEAIAASAAKAADQPKRSGETRLKVQEGSEVVSAEAGAQADSDDSKRAGAARSIAQESSEAVSADAEAGSGSNDAKRAGAARSTSEESSVSSFAEMAPPPVTDEAHHSEPAVEAADVAPKPRKPRAPKAKSVEVAEVAAPSEAATGDEQRAGAARSIAQESSEAVSADAEANPAVDDSKRAGAARSTHEEAAPRARRKKPESDALSLGLDLPDETPEVVSSDAISSDGVTRLLATAYIGIGNRLFIRGHGPGLSWDKGVPMQFVSIGKWRWETSVASAPVKFKLFKNDETECTPLADSTVEPGHQREVTAQF